MSADRILVQTALGRALQARHAWRRQYGDEPTKPAHASILVALDELGANATPEAVKAIIGNGSWTLERCDVCNGLVDTWVRLGDAPDYDSTTLEACIDCLRIAVRLLEAASA